MFLGEVAQTEGGIRHRRGVERDQENPALVGVIRPLIVGVIRPGWRVGSLAMEHQNKRKSFLKLFYLSLFWFLVLCSCCIKWFWMTYRFDLLYFFNSCLPNPIWYSCLFCQPLVGQKYFYNMIFPFFSLLINMFGTLWNITTLWNYGTTSFCCFLF